MEKKTVKGVIGTFGITVLNKIIVLASTIYLARNLDLTSYGYYATIIASLLLLSIPAQLGFSNLLVREVAGYLEDKASSYISGIFQFSLISISVAATIITIGAYFSIFAFLSLSEVYEKSWYVALPLLIITSLLMVYGAVLRGCHYVVLGQLPEKIIFPLIFLVFILLAHTWHQDYMSVDVVLVLRVLGAVIALMLAMVITNRLLIIGYPKYDISKWGRAIIPFTMVSGLSVLNTQSDVLMVSFVLGPERAGIYQATAKLSEVASFLLVVVNVAVQPFVRKLVVKNDKELLQKVLLQISRISLMFAVPVFVICSIYATEFLRLIYGDSYGSGSLVLVILLFAQMINALAGSVGLLLNMSGYESITAKVIGLGVIVNISLNAALIPILGISGAAMASLISMLVWNFVLVIFAHKKLGLWTPALGYFFIKKP